MAIARIGITEPVNGMPVMSRAVVRGDTVYLSGVVPDPVGDVTSQTTQVLEKIDQLLAAVWNAWVDPRNPPVRACVRADLYRPEVLVEIMVTAAR